MTIDYKNSKVYKIWSPKGDKIYIGSTTKKMLCQRMTAHRTCYKFWKTHKGRFITSFLLFEEYGLDNCYIELLEAKECLLKDELNQLEGKYIRNLVCVNKNITGRTLKEYRDDHKEEIKIKKSIPFTCICGSTCRKDDKAKHERTTKHKLFLEKPITQ